MANNGRQGLGRMDLIVDDISVTCRQFLVFAWRRQQVHLSDRKSILPTLRSLADEEIAQTNFMNESVDCTPPPPPGVSR